LGGKFGPESTKAHHLAEERARAYKYVKEVAVLALTHGSTHAFELIWIAFQAYEKATKKADRYTLKYFPDNYSIFYVFVTQKTITDAYWDLTPQMKALWDAVPELKMWREQYI